MAGRYRRKRIVELKLDLKGKGKKESIKREVEKLDKAGMTGPEIFNKLSRWHMPMPTEEAMMELGYTFGPHGVSREPKQKVSKQVLSKKRTFLEDIPITKTPYKDIAAMEERTKVIFLEQIKKWENKTGKKSNLTGRERSAELEKILNNLRKPRIRKVD